MNPGIPGNETTSGMVYRGHSKSHSLHLSHQQVFVLACSPPKEGAPFLYPVLLRPIFEPHFFSPILGAPFLEPPPEVSGAGASQVADTSHPLPVGGGDEPKAAVSERWVARVGR